MEALVFVGPGELEMQSIALPSPARDEVLLPAANLVELAPACPTAHGSLTEPLAVGLHAVRCADVRPDDKPGRPSGNAPVRRG